jgi:urea carboxylase
VLRFRGHALMQALEAKALDGVVDLTPGIRSLQVHYQPETLSLEDLLAIVVGLWDAVCAAQDLKVPSRIVHLPLSWDDPACQLAIEKYMTTVRKDAPWCPSNLEFIRRINDLENLDAVYRTVFEASYLVMGLGDVYLGAPVATPLDPRHRLVTTKYNPARTWTAENSVGIGGAYMCIYGMEGPGGYQFVGRTLQMWNRYRAVEAFGGQPWLLRFFDQIRFYPVSAEELLRIRRDFPLGRYPLKIEETELRLSDYQAFLDREAEGIDAFRQQQRGAFDAEHRQPYCRQPLAGLGSRGRAGGGRRRAGDPREHEDGNSAHRAGRRRGQGSPRPARLAGPRRAAGGGDRGGVRPLGTRSNRRVDRALSIHQPAQRAGNELGPTGPTRTTRVEKAAPFSTLRRNRA